MSRKIATIGSLRDDKAGGDGGNGEAFYAGSGTAVYGGAGSADKPTDITIVKWKNGFTVNDGPLRPYDGAKERAFMKDVEEGHVPRELASMGRDIGVAMTDKSGEDYSPRAGGAGAAAGGAATRPAFGGSGQSLGGGGGGGGGAAAGTRAGRAAAAAVDEGKPTTTIAVRLLSGKRERVVLNRDHTLGDLLAHVRTLTGGDAAFTLVGGFPPKPLTGSDKTLEALGLLNCAVTQRKA